MNTYPAMNSEIVKLLCATDDNPLMLYAAARIEELESEVSHAQRLENELAEARRMGKENHRLIQTCLAFIDFGEVVSGYKEKDLLGELNKQNHKYMLWVMK